MKFHVITLFPEMIEQGLQWGVVGRAFEKKLAQLSCLNPRDFTSDLHKTVDDRPFGGGDGMLMLFDPLQKAIESLPLCEKPRRHIYLSPRGQLLKDELVEELSQELSQDKELVLLCGRYGGVDERFVKHNNFTEVSVGDYVVSGGELPALTLIDAILRKQPGVLGHNKSAIEDSFAQGRGLEAPAFTRPAENSAGKVPGFLLSGHHANIKAMRKMIGKKMTLLKRPDVAKSLAMSWESSDEKLFNQLTDDEKSLLGIKKGSL